MISAAAMVFSLAFVGLAAGGIVGILDSVVSRSPPKNAVPSRLFDVIRDSASLRVLVLLVLLVSAVFIPVGLTLVVLAVLLPFFGEQSSLVTIPAFLLGLLCIVPGQRLGEALIRLRQEVGGRADG